MKRGALFLVSLCLLLSPGHTTIPHLAHWGGEAPAVPQFRAATKPEATARFEAWVRQNAADAGCPTFEKLDMLKIDNAGHGLIASEDIAPNELVGCIPYDMTLGIESVRKTKNPELFQELCSSRSAPPEMCSMLMLLYEMRIGEDSFWAPYFPILPSAEQLTGTLYWSQDMRSWVNQSLGLSSRDYVMDDYLHRMWSHFSAGRLGPISQHFPTDYYNFERIKWAYAIVMSRAWGRDGGKGSKLMVPYADVANHNVEATQGVRILTLEFNDNDRRIDQFARGLGWKAGDEVFGSYGNMPNHDLLGQYGFTLQPNPLDHVVVRPDEVWNNPENPLAEPMQALVQAAGIYPQVHYVDIDGNPSKHLLQMFRIGNLQNHEIQHGMKTITGERVSIEHEYRSLRAFRDKLRELKQAFNTTEEEDQATLEEIARAPVGDPSWIRQPFIYIFRVEKEILRKAYRKLGRLWHEVLFD